jgi:putative endonuclease
MLNRLRELFGRPPAGGSGAMAERHAAEWLRRERGFRILAMNWRNPRDLREELDLVCEDGGVLVFVEVKARNALAMVPGYYAVDRRKKRALTRACKAYLARLRPKPFTFRFDIVEVALPIGRGTPVVRHFENIPLFSKHYGG